VVRFDWLADRREHEVCNDQLVAGTVEGEVAEFGEIEKVKTRALQQTKAGSTWREWGPIFRRSISDVTLRYKLKSFFTSYKSPEERLHVISYALGYPAPA
jgi:hypothetical protein